MRRRRDRSAAIPLMMVVAMLVAAAGCREAPQPVGRLAVEPGSILLPYPEYDLLRLSFEPLAPLEGLEGEALVFVHLLEEPGSVLRTFDHPLPGPWKAGEPLDYEIELYQSVLAPPLGAGSYLLSVGLYDRAGHRWALAAEGREVDRQEYQVGEVIVPEPSGKVPMFYFSATWLPPEAGSDRQVLARRWLTGEGVVRATDLPGPGSVWMVLRIPPVEAVGQTLVVEEGSETPSVLVTTSCGQTQVGISGAGSHAILLPVAAVDEAGEGVACEIRVQPNFYLIRVDDLTRRVLMLENLAWRPRREDGEGSSPPRPSSRG